MRVRLVAPGRSPTGERRIHGFLTIGHEYVVLAITVSQRQGVQFLLLDDETERPGWHKAVDFDLVADSVPSSWRVQVGLGGHVDSLEIAPASWLEPRFFLDYWGDDPDAAKAAEQVFQRELEVIMRETGQDG
jgi:hypothetical protein